jgi:hypothetical protein
MFSKVLDHFGPGIYRNNGYLMVSCNGGLNQMRAAVSNQRTLGHIQSAACILLGIMDDWID